MSANNHRLVSSILVAVWVSFGLHVVSGIDAHFFGKAAIWFSFFVIPLMLGFYNGFYSCKFLTEE